MRPRINRDVFTADSDNDAVDTPATDDHVDIDDDDDDELDDEELDEDTQISMLSTETNTPFDIDEGDDSMAIDTMDDDDDDDDDEFDEDIDVQLTSTPPASTNRNSARNISSPSRNKTRGSNGRYGQASSSSSMTSASLKRSVVERAANTRKAANEKKTRESGTGNDSDFSLFTAEEIAELSGSEEEYAPQRNDLSSMTKRQRAKYLEEEQNDLMELPVETKKRKLTQEEVALRRTEVLRKREQQRKKKMEDIHRETIDKLLKKPSARKNKKPDEDELVVDEEAADIPLATHVHYVANDKGATLSLPVGADFPGAGQHTSYPPSTPNCTAPGCGQPRKYKHPQQQWLACSLEHYRMQLKA